MVVQPEAGGLQVPGQPGLHSQTKKRKKKKSGCFTKINPDFQVLLKNQNTQRFPVAIE
jgi:hypothetical protein